MEISMFGPSVVRDGDRVLGPGDLGGVKPRQVLELLLLARGHLVCTDVIADAIWPEGEEPRNVVATLNTYGPDKARSSLLFCARLTTRRGTHGTYSRVRRRHVAGRPPSKGGTQAGTGRDRLGPGRHQDRVT